MPAKKKPVSRAHTVKRSVPQPVARLVQADAATMDRWLRQTAPDRSKHPMPDRLEALLWSWPIRLGFSTQPFNPLWQSKLDGLETRQRKAAILTRLTNLAETWYSDMVYPDAVYLTDDSHALYPNKLDPSNSPSKMPESMLQDLCAELRKLSGVIVPDPHNDRRWVLMLLEYGWGDGRLKDRRELQDPVMMRLRKAQVRQRVCEIGEHARDAAYVAVRTSRCLDALHKDKARARAFKDWLRDAKTHKSFVEEHLTASWGAAFQVIERMSEAVDFYMTTASTEPSQRETAGGQRRPWVKQARQELKTLGIAEPARNDLLKAWNLLIFPQ